MSNDRLTAVQPEGFAKPRGYSNGMIGRGKVLHIGGQIGWQPDTTFATDDFIEQFAQALDNVLAVVETAGGHGSDIAKMTVYVTDIDAYRTRAAELGPIWRERLGRHYPAMALVAVSNLVEPRAKVEIEATAYLPEEIS